MVVVKRYNMKDSLMTQTGKVHRQHFINNKLDFTGFNVKFTDPYEADWLAAITASESVGTDDQRKGAQLQETADVVAQMKLARKKHNEVSYWVDEAWPGDEKKRKQFGLDNYPNARNSDHAMIFYLANLYSMAKNQYEADLVAAGYSVAGIDNILTLKAALETEDVEQEVFI